MSIGHPTRNPLLLLSRPLGLHRRGTTHHLPSVNPVEGHIIRIDHLYRALESLSAYQLPPGVPLLGRFPAARSQNKAHQQSAFEGASAQGAFRWVAPGVSPGSHLRLSVASINHRTIKKIPLHRLSHQLLQVVFNIPPPPLSQHMPIRIFPSEELFFAAGTVLPSFCATRVPSSLSFPARPVSEAVEPCRRSVRRVLGCVWPRAWEGKTTKIGGKGRVIIRSAVTE